MSTTLDIRQRERQKARRFWDGLPKQDRWALGDQLVLGDFDWRDWFNDKPTGAFLNELDYQRTLWEDTLDLACIKQEAE